MPHASPRTIPSSLRRPRLPAVLARTYHYRWLLLLAVAVFLLAETDFRHMTMFDQIYVGAVGLYSILLVVRVVLEYRKNTAGQDTTQK